MPSRSWVGEPGAAVQTVRLYDIHAEREGLRHYAEPMPE